MSLPLVYLNGEFRTFAEAGIPLNDLGFIHGVTVSEQIRTVGGKLFLLDEHLARFHHGVTTLGIDLPESERISDIVQELTQRNWRLEHEGSDLGICLLATPGSTQRFGPVANDRPLLAVHTYRLPFSQINSMFDRGPILATVSTAEVPPACWPKSIKIRSRAHYFLADQEARTVAPDAIALLASETGQLRETPTSTPVYLMQDGSWVASPPDEILDSITLGFFLQIASDLGIEIERREMPVGQLAFTQSILLLNSLFLATTAREIVWRNGSDQRDSRRLLDREPPEWLRIRNEFMNRVGCDFERQAVEMSDQVEIPRN